ncbi:hypothetical protein RB598_000662 [Gaeumannomyces tritici]
MVVKQKLTPESFLSAPRRSVAVPNQDGSLALFTVSRHAFGVCEERGGETAQDLVVVSLESGDTYTLSSDPGVHDAVWIPGGKHASGAGPLLWLESVARGQGDGETRMRVMMPRPASSTPEAESIGSRYVAGVIPAPVRALKLCALEDGSVACAVVAKVAPDGSMLNSAPVSKSLSTARIYDGWEMQEPDKYSIWHSRLVKDLYGRWKLAGPFQNALRGTNLEAPDSSTYDFGDAGAAYDLGPRGIAFLAPSRQGPPASGNRISSCSDVYFLPLDPFVVEEDPMPGLGISGNVPPSRRPQPVKITTLEHAQEGRCSNLRFSPDGAMLAFLKAPAAARNPETRLFIAHADAPPSATLSSNHPYPSSLSAFDVLCNWDLRPSRFEYHPSGRSIVVMASDSGCVELHRLALEGHAPVAPTLLFRPSVGSVHGFHVVSKGAAAAAAAAATTTTTTPATAGQQLLLVSSSSLTDGGGVFQLVGYDNIGALDHDGFESATLAAGPDRRGGVRFDLSRVRQVSEMYFEGGGDYCVRAFVVRPSNFDADKRYPLVLLLHGDLPAGASNDMWHLSWNPAVLAEQGYVVVLPDIAGSLGFGVDFATETFGEWGGRSYNDLANCMEYLKDIPYIDMDRAAIAGAGSGGYMVNWMLGQPLARKFKAAVCQNGIFDTGIMQLQLQQQQQDLADNASELGARAPPTLIIHGERDRRVPVTEALAAFRTLQVMGVPSRLLTFPDENQWVQRPENALEWHHVLFDWLKRHIGPGLDAPAVPDAVGASHRY